MTKRKVTQLFAVVALGISAPAAASPDGSRNPSATAPRTLPSGAPACGNVQGKGPRRPCTTETASPVVAPVVALPAAIPTVTPRTLPSGAPACGNVLDKVNGDKSDHSYKQCLLGYPDAEKQRVLEARRQVSKKLVEKMLALIGVQPAAAPRRMRNGAPACGNVASRAARSCE